MFKGVDHVVIAVKDLETAIPHFETLYGMPAEDRGEPPGAGFRNAYFRFDDTFVELISPLSDEGPVARKLERSGEGVHLVAMRVDNIEQAVEQLREKGVRLIGDPGPGRPITGMVFIHPASAGGVLMQVVER